MSFCEYPASCIGSAAYDPSLLQPYVEEDGVAAFLSASVVEQERIQKRHKRQSAWPLLAEEALACLKVLPDCLEKFKLSEEDIKLIKAQSEKSQLTRKQNKIRIPHAGDMLQAAIQMMERATTQESYPFLVLPMLLVSGRRMTEIYSPKSTFRQASSDRSVYFYGQLKKKGEEVTEYEIPLLCPAPLFLRAVGMLRAKQAEGVCRSPDFLTRRRISLMMVATVCSLYLAFRRSMIAWGSSPNISLTATVS